MYNFKYKYVIMHIFVLDEILVTYISRGLLSSLVDAKQVLEIISDGNRKTKNHIVINTYALIDGNITFFILYLFNYFLFENLNFFHGMPLISKLSFLYFQSK